MDAAGIMLHVIGNLPEVLPESLVDGRQDQRVILRPVYQLLSALPPGDLSAILEPGEAVYRLLQVLRRDCFRGDVEHFQDTFSTVGGVQVRVLQHLEDVQDDPEI